jgi:hypothetical protein
VRRGEECNEREKEEHVLLKRHRNKMEGAPNPDCSFCSAKFTLEHILWQCKETEEERRKSKMTKEVWEKGEEQAKMLVEYVKNIE